MSKADEQDLPQHLSQDLSSKRGATDESLSEERRRTDLELTSRWDEIEAETDRLVEVARQRADARLRASRARTDQLTREGGTLGAAERVALAQERQDEQAGLVAERTAEDRRRAKERNDERSALTASLRFEREATDRHLVRERVHADEDLERREAFFGMVSHDLGTLLGGISMNASIICDRARGTDGTEQMLAAAGRLRSFSGRMIRLIGDMVDGASIAAGKFSVDRRGDDLLGVVREAKEVFAPAAAAKQISMTVDLPQTSRASSSFDYDRILQVLANLLGNAMKFTPPGGRVVIRLVSEEETIHVSVADTGSGVPPDQLSAIFERFRQGPTTRGGLGLGLFISKYIVEAHGGTMWATSGPEGGSTFHFRLPRLD